MSNIPAAIPFIPVIAAGVSTVGGLIAGNRQAKQNQQLITNQNQQLAQVHQLANTLVSRVSRAEYESQANSDVQSALQDVFSAMAQRGMGRSTAALTATAGTAGQIRSGYGQQYLKDRLAALQTAGTMISGVASTPRMGYDANPYAGLQSGLKGMSDAAAYYTANGFPGRNTTPQTTTWGGLPGFGVSYPSTTSSYGGSYGTHYR